MYIIYALQNTAISTILTSFFLKSIRTFVYYVCKKTKQKDLNDEMKKNKYIVWLNIYLKLRQDANTLIAYLNILKTRQIQHSHQINGE